MEKPSIKLSILLLFAAATPITCYSVAHLAKVNWAIFDESFEFALSCILSVLFFPPVFIAARRIGFRAGIATSIALGVMLGFPGLDQPDIKGYFSYIAVMIGMSISGISITWLILRDQSTKHVIQQRADDLRHQSTELSRQLEERERIENTLRQSETQYRLLAENMADWIWLTDLNLNYIYQSPSVTRMRGFTVEEAVAQTVEETLTQASYAYVMGELDKEMRIEESEAKDTGRTGAVKMEVTCKDGSTVWTEHSISVVRNEKGEPAALIGIARDITERMKAEAELRAQKELIDRILTSTPDAVVVLNQDMQVILVNQTFTNVFHVKEGEVDGKPLSAIQGIRSLATPVREAFAGRGTGESVQFHHRMAGVNRTFIADIIPMYEHEVLLIARDVTDERERTEKLYLTDRLVSVGEMAAGVAHEVNNPLTAVITLSHLLVDSDLPDGVREDVQDIHNEAQRAANVVRNLLLFARGEGAEKQPEQVNDLIEEVVGLRAYKNKVDNIRIDTRLGASLPDVMVDRSEMRQVFLNIVLNAEQAMLKAHGCGLLTITSQRVNGDVRISFADDGPGFDKHVRKRAFDPFFTTKQVGEGTGLGLSISYGIVTAHGGHIRAKSAPGQGATVTVELPAAGNELEKRKISSIDEASADDVIHRNGVKTA